MKINKLIGIIVLFCLVYFIQFFCMPRIFEHYFPRSNEATLLFVITLTITVIMGMYMFSDKMIYWVIGDLCYLFLVWNYSANGAYGIGMNGVTLAGAQANYDKSVLWFYMVFLVVIILFLEIVIKIGRRILKKFVRG